MAEHQQDLAQAPPDRAELATLALVVYRADIRRRSPGLRKRRSILVSGLAC